MAKNQSSPRVMLDSNIIISGITYPRCCFEILKHVIKQDIKLVVSEAILREVNKNIQIKFPTYVNDLKDFLLDCPFELVQHPAKTEIAKNRDLIRDVSDIPIALAAIQAGVDFFVTGDRDFLGDNDTLKKLKKHFMIVSPIIFLKEIMNWPDDDLEKIRLRKWVDLQK